MSAAVQLQDREPGTVLSVRALANQAFSRASGAPLVEGNLVRLLGRSGSCIVAGKECFCLRVN